MKKNNFYLEANYVFVQQRSRPRIFWLSGLISKNNNKLKTLLTFVFLMLLQTFVFAQVTSYTFSQSSGTYAALPTSTTLFTSGWDDGVATVTVPFTFTFDGVGYTSASNNSKDYFTFSSTKFLQTDFPRISAICGDTSIFKI